MIPHLTRRQSNETDADLLTDVSFEYAGQNYLINARKPTTYRITGLDSDDGYLFTCSMTGKDGSVVTFNLTMDDIRANLEFAEGQAAILYSPHIT